MKSRPALRAQKSIWNVKAKAFVGKTFSALVVAPGVARMESQAPEVDGVTYLKAARGKALPEVGEIVRVKIKSVKGYDFEGVVVK